MWHSWTRVANAACNTINHEIENAADNDIGNDDEDDDLKSPSSMQSRQLSQVSYSYSSSSSFPLSSQSQSTLTSCVHLFHSCGQAGARKCQSVRVPQTDVAPGGQATPKIALLPEAQFQAQAETEASSNVTLLRPKQKPHNMALAMPLGGSSVCDHRNISLTLFP